MKPNRSPINPKIMKRAIDNLRRRNPTGYMQWQCCAPFGIVPSHAWEDSNAAWWYSEAAFNTLQNLRNAE